MGVRDAITEWAKAQNEGLTAHDRRFRRSVTVRHHDGSFFHLVNAFAVSKSTIENCRGLQVKIGWIVCFTEHNGTLIWDAEDLDSVAEHGSRKPPAKATT